MSVDSYGILIGSNYIVRFYALILILGVIAGGAVARRMMVRMGRDPELILDAMGWVVIGGIIGARLYHILTPSKALVDQGIDVAYYLTHPLDAINIRQGGLGMPGAVAGGLVGLILYARRAKAPLFILIDAITPGVPLGQAIGRWGNFVNQELYGPPTDLPWGIPIRPENRLPGYESIERFHPLFLYESILNLANMALLLWIWRRYRRQLLPGDLFLVYLVTYPLIRFGLEFIRLDYVPLFGVNFNQILMLGIAAASAIAFSLRHRRKPAA